MSKSKKWLSIVMCGVMLLAVCLAGCQSDPAGETPDAKTPAPSVEAEGEAAQNTGGG